MKKGYKNTEIGVIPEEWEVDEIGNVSTVIGGGTPSTNNPIFWNGSINWFTPTEIGKNKYVCKSNREITEDGLKNSSARLLPKGTILLTSRAGIGDLAILKKESCTNQGFQSLITKNNIDNEFLYYLISISKTKLIEKASGSTFLEISSNNLKQIQIPFPPLPEQKAIAAVLSDTDNLIQALEKKIAKKQLIKKGAMQKLLIPKEDWVTKTLGEVLIYEQPTKYIVKSTKYNDNYDIPVLTAGKSFVLGYTNEKQCIFKNYPVIIFDDFTTASKFVDFPFKVKSSAMKILKPKNEEVNLRFVFEIMQQIDFPLGDHKRHWISEFQPLEIKVPKSKEERTRIAQILSDMDSEIETLEKKLAKYKELKQGLMQKLLTGAIRLTVVSQVENKVTNVVSKEKELLKKVHNWAINEAVVISVLSNRFGSEEYPLGRKRYTKLSYLLHRYHEQEAIGYRKKAAGPYNPDTKYKGPEKIAIKNKYIELCEEGKYNGFVAAENITQAEEYFEKWYGQEVLHWIEQFRYEKNDTLELWATVDMAIKDLEKENKQVSAQSVKNLINNHKEWKPKLKRPVFSDDNIKQAIEKVIKLFN